MSKSKFGLPFVYTLPTPGDDVEVGGETGHGGDHGVPMNYNSWLNSIWKFDLDNDGDFDEYDYGDWWRSGGSEFTRELWNEFNPTLSYDVYVLGIED